MKTKTKTPAPMLENLPPVPSLGSGILVRFAPVTNSKGARWIASLRWDRETVFRATVGFHFGSTQNAGRDAAARACLEKFESFCNDEPVKSREKYFRLTGCASFNSGDSYIYTFENV
jgi:hypothetical protein